MASCNVERDHAPALPFLFRSRRVNQPWSSIVEDGAAILIPPGSEAVHHEVEMGVVIGATATDVEGEDDDIIETYVAGLPAG